MAEYRARIPFAADLSRLVKAGIEADTDGLRTLLINMIRSNTPPQREVFIKPNTDGSWPTVTRDPSRPGTLMWLRPLDATTLAPVPTAAVGYLPTDLLFPGETTSGAVTVPKGMFASDSFTTSTVAQAQDYTGDAFAGGQPITWAVDKSRGSGNLADRRARVGTTGLDVYDGVYVYSTYPNMPTNCALRTTFTISSLTANNSMRYDIRGGTYATAGAAKLSLEASADGATVTAKMYMSGSSATIGSAPLAPGTTTVVIEDDGNTQIKVTVGGVTFAAVTVPAGRGNFAAFSAWPYTNFVVKNFTIEVI